MTASSGIAPGARTSGGRAARHIVGALLFAASLGLAACAEEARKEPPAIVVQPQAASVTLCDQVTFSVVATGSPPLVYQWTRDGQPLPGATSADLRLEAASLAAAGDYAVEITNGYGQATSATAALAVLDPGPPGPEPTALVLDDADGFAIVGDQLFWGNGNAIFTTSAVCPGPRLLAFAGYTLMIRPGPLVEAQGDLYWMDANAGSQGVFRTSPTTLQTVRTVENPGYPGAFFEREGQLTWTDNENLRILTAPLAGGIPRSMTVMAPSPFGQIGGLATDGTSYYWSGWTGESWAVVGTMDIRRTPVGGGESVILAADQGVVWEVVTDGERVYWSGMRGVAPEQTAFLRSIDVAGQGPVVELSSRPQSRGAAVVLDGANVYWGSVPMVVPDVGTVGTGELQIMPKDGSQTPTVIYTSEVGPNVVLVRGQQVYWSESSRQDLPGRGRIMRMGR